MLYQKHNNKLVWNQSIDCGRFGAYESVMLSYKSQQCLGNLYAMIFIWNVLCGSINDVNNRVTDIA